MRCATMLPWGHQRRTQSSEFSDLVACCSSYEASRTASRPTRQRTLSPILKSRPSFDPENREIDWPFFFNVGERTFAFREQVDEESPVSDSQLLLLTLKKENNFHNIVTIVGLKWSSFQSWSVKRFFPHWRYFFPYWRYFFPHWRYFFFSPEIWKGFVEGVSLDEGPTCRPRWESWDLLCI